MLCYLNFSSENAVIYIALFIENRITFDALRLRKKQHELQHPQFKWILSLFQCQLPEEFINKLEKTEKNTIEFCYFSRGRN